MQSFTTRYGSCSCAVEKLSMPRDALEFHSSCKTFLFSCQNFPKLHFIILWPILLELAYLSFKCSKKFHCRSPCLEKLQEQPIFLVAIGFFCGGNLVPRLQNLGAILFLWCSLLYHVVYGSIMYAPGQFLHATLHCTSLASWHGRLPWQSGQAASCTACARHSCRLSRVIVVQPSDPGLHVLRGVPLW